ncbi:MAG: MFS transporter [Tepidisphaeraceae bacterium]
MTTSQHQPAASAIGPRLSIMMFLQFFIWGAWYVSITGWMNKMGIDGLTSWAYTVGPIAAIVSPFFLGMVADRFFASQRILGVMHLLGGVALCLVPIVVESTKPADLPAVGSAAPTTQAAAPATQPQAQSTMQAVVKHVSPTTFWHPFVLLLLAHMLCYMPTLSLTNSLSFAHMSDPQTQFPMVRVWGTIGWIVGNLVVGGNLKTFGLNVVWIAEGDQSVVQLYIAGFAALLLGVYSFTLPHTPPPAAGKPFSTRQALGLDSLKLLKQPAFAVFVICSFLICIPLAAYYQQARNFVDFSKFSNGPLTMLFGQVSEIFFMAAMPLFFARLGVKKMLALGMLAWVVRYGLFAGAAVPDVKWLIFLGILLHGICYDFFFVTGFIYVDKKAPADIRGQAQGFLVLLTQGLGLGVGAQVIGALIGHYGATAKAASGEPWQGFWLVACGMALVILVIFYALFRNDAEGKATAQK